MISQTRSVPDRTLQQLKPHQMTELNRLHNLIRNSGTSASLTYINYYNGLLFLQLYCPEELYPWGILAIAPTYTYQTPILECPKFTMGMQITTKPNWVCVPYWKALTNAQRQRLQMLPESSKWALLGVERITYVYLDLESEQAKAYEILGYQHCLSVIFPNGHKTDLYFGEF